MAYQSLSDKAQPVKYTPLSETAGPHPQPTDANGVSVPATPAFSSLSDKAVAARSYQNANYLPGKAPFEQAYDPASNHLGVDGNPLPTPPAAQSFGQKALDFTKSAADKVYTVGTGLLLPGSTPEERHNLHFLYTVAQSVPGAVVDTAKQVVTHPFRSAEDLVGGVARGIANTTTDMIINTLVPAKDQETTRAEVQATLDKYLSPPDTTGIGGSIAQGGEIGGSAAPAILGGVVGGGVGANTAARLGLKGLAAKALQFGGEALGFVAPGQASVPANAQPGTRLDQALNDVIGLGLFKLGGAALEKAKGIIAKTTENAPKLLERAQTAYDALPEDLKAKGIIPKPEGVTSLTDQGVPPEGTKTPSIETTDPTAAAFDNSTGQQVIGKVGQADIALGSFGKNAIERKTAGGQPDRLPPEELASTLQNVKEVYRAGDSPFRKDNVVLVADMPDGETRAVIVRKNAAGQEEVINFFKVGKDVQNFKDNLATFGTPEQSRTAILGVENQRPNPLADGSNKSVAQANAGASEVALIEKPVERPTRGARAAAEAPTLKPYREINGFKITVPKAVSTFDKANLLEGPNFTTDKNVIQFGETPKGLVVTGGKTTEMMNSKVDEMIKELSHSHDLGAPTHVDTGDTSIRTFYFNLPDGQQVRVQTKYYNYFTNTFPDVSFRGTDPMKPIGVFSKDRIVGIVAPVHPEGGKPEPIQNAQVRQVEQVKATLKEGPKSIKQVAEETKILEPNVRRILGVGAKDGTFERVDTGVYTLKKANGEEVAWIEAGDAKDVLGRMASEGKKFDMVFLDPAYFSRALIGGNRGIKSYDFIMPEEFRTVMDHISSMVKTPDTHVYLMLSGARTAQADMLKYATAAQDAGFKVVGEGSYKKLNKDGSPVTNVRGEEAAAERLILFTKNGEARAGDVPTNLNFRFVRPSIAKSYATEKPAELLKALIEQSTLKGEHILDPFAGSGVAGAEAVKVGRKATLIEKKPEVVSGITKPRVEEAVKNLPTEPAMTHTFRDLPKIKQAIISYKMDAGDQVDAAKEIIDLVKKGGPEVDSLAKLSREKLRDRLGENIYRSGREDGLSWSFDEDVAKSMGQNVRTLVFNEEMLNRVIFYDGLSEKQLGFRWNDWKDLVPFRREEEILLEPKKKQLVDTSRRLVIASEHPVSPGDQVRIMRKDGKGEPIYGIVDKLDGGHNPSKQTAGKEYGPGIRAFVDKPPMFGAAIYRYDTYDITKTALTKEQLATIDEKARIQHEASQDMVPTGKEYVPVSERTFSLKSAELTKEKTSGLGNTLAPFIKINGEKIETPTQLVSKTDFKQLVATLPGKKGVFTITEVDGQKRMVLETKNGKMSLRPSALGLVDRNLNVGDKISVNAEDIKPAGTAFRAINERGGVEGFTPKDLEDPTSPEVTAKLDALTKQSDIVKFLAETLDVPIKRGKFRQQALGVYKGGYGGPRVVRIKAGGLPTVFHEVFHHLNRLYKFADGLKGLDHEREALLTEYGKPPDAPSRRRSEAFSEFGRFLLTGRMDKIQAKAPVFAERFGEAMLKYPDIKEVLDSAAANYQRWAEQPATAKILSHISIGMEDKGPLAGRIASTAHDLYTQALDDLHPLSEFSKIARETNPGLAANADPYILARNMRGWIGRADTFLNKGTFGQKFWKEEGGKVVPDFTGKSFSDIVKPYEAAGRMDDLRTYLVAKRATELQGRNIRTGITADDSRAAIAALETKYPELKKTAEELYTYQDAVLEYAKESGLMDKATFEKMREMNKNYVPFFRIYEEAQARGFMGGKALGSNRNPVKAIKGSEREIIDPLESIVKNTYSLINAADRNSVAVAMTRLSKTDYRLGRLVENVPGNMRMTKVNVNEVMQAALGPEYDYLSESNPEISAAFGEKMVDIFRPSYATKAGEISVMDGGVFKTFEVDPTLYRAIQALDKEDVALAVKLLSYPASWLRAGATLTPDFALRNPIRDQFSALVYSKAGYLPGIDLARGMFELFKQGDAYQLWKIAGGESATLVSIDRPGLQKTLKEVLASKKAQTLHYVKNPIDLLREFSNTFEVATRLGEMKKVLAKTKDPTAAAFAAREVTLDFNRIGAKTRAVNLLVAFWNANVQGTDKFLREIRLNPGKTMAKTFVGITLPSILLYYANRQDPRWKEIPQWEKDLFWIVFTKDHIIRIPKPFELGVLFGSVPERILEYMDTQNPNLFAELESAVASGASPGFIPTGILPIVENISNYSFFLDRPIVPNSKQGLPPEFQASQYTSEISKVIGETLGYSPAKIDNIIHGYTGGLGVYATQMVDSFLKNTGIRKVPEGPTKGLEDVVGIKAFLVRNPVGSGSESVNELYNAYTAAQAGLTYVKKQAELGNTDQAKQYIKDHPEVISAPQLSAMVNIFSSLNKAREEILNSGILSGDEKKKRLDKIDATMTELAAKTMQMVNKTKPSPTGE